MSWLMNHHNLLQLDINYMLYGRVDFDNTQLDMGLLVLLMDNNYPLDIARNLN